MQLLPFKYWFVPLPFDPSWYQASVLSLPFLLCVRLSSGPIDLCISEKGLAGAWIALLLFSLQDDASHFILGWPVLLALAQTSSTISHSRKPCWSGLS